MGDKLKGYLTVYCIVDGACLSHCVACCGFDANLDFPRKGCGNNIGCFNGESAGRMIAIGAIRHRLVHVEVNFLRQGF